MNFHLWTSTNCVDSIRPITIIHNGLVNSHTQSQPVTINTGEVYIISTQTRALMGDENSIEQLKDNDELSRPSALGSTTLMTLPTVLSGIITLITVSLGGGDRCD